MSTLYLQTAVNGKSASDGVQGNWLRVRHREGVVRAGLRLLESMQLLGASKRLVIFKILCQMYFV